MNCQVNFNELMEIKSFDEIDGMSEPIATHISIPCTMSQKARYKRLGNQLEEIRRKKALTISARRALDNVMDDLEKLLRSDSIPA